MPDIKPRVPGMPHAPLTIRSITARPIVLKLKRPVVARIATLSEWPVILIDLQTEQGITGRSYLEPYVVKSMRYLVPALHDFGDMLKGRRARSDRAVRCSAQVTAFRRLRRLVDDRRIWPRHGSVGCAGQGGEPATLRAARWHGWSREILQQQWSVVEISRRPLPTEAIELRDEGGFTGLKLRLGRERIADDLATLDAVRKAVGDGIHLMVDFNQGLTLAEALQRCHMIDDHGLAWIEEPIVYDNLDGYARLAAELKTPLQIGENFYGPREMHKALQRGACDLVMPDFMRIGGVTGWMRAAAIAGSAGIPMSTHLYPEVAAHVMRVTETAHWLEWQDWADPICSSLRDQRRAPAYSGRARRWH